MSTAARRDLAGLPRLALPGCLLPLLLCGCGPTPEELLVYEMVVVAVGLGLGLALWGIGWRLGRRIHGRWFVCSHCLAAQRAKVRDGQTQACPACGQTSSVNELDPPTLREVLASTGTVVSRRPAWWWSLLLTTCTHVVFLAITGMIFGLGHLGVTADWMPEWLGVPLGFTTCMCPGPPWCWPLLGYGLYFYSYTIACLVEVGVSRFDLPCWAMFSGCYVLTAAAVGAHCYAGLRRWRRGWLLPIGVAVANSIAALIGYLLKWPFS